MLVNIQKQPVGEQYSYVHEFFAPRTAETLVLRRLVLSHPRLKADPWWELYEGSLELTEGALRRVAERLKIDAYRDLIAALGALVSYYNAFRIDTQGQDLPRHLKLDQAWGGRQRQWRLRSNKATTPAYTLETVVTY